MLENNNKMSGEKPEVNDTHKIRKKKKRKKKNYLLRFIILCIMGAGIFYFSTTSFFDVTAIEVKNNSYYTGEQIIQMADAKVGGNLFKLDTRTMKKKLLKDAYIKNVSVNRSIPGSIIITVEERREAAVIPYGNKYIILDENGLVLRHSDVEPKLTLLLGMTIKEMAPGNALIVEENRVLTDTLFMLKAMEINDMYFKKIDISNTIIKAYIYDNLICEGTPENILSSMEKGNLQMVLKDLFESGVERGTVKIGSEDYCSFSPML